MPVLIESDANFYALSGVAEPKGCARWLLISDELGTHAIGDGSRLGIAR